MARFQKEFHELPSCTRLKFPVTDLNWQRILTNLPQKPSNDSKAKIRERWVLLGEEGASFEWPELMTLLNSFPCESMYRVHLSKMPAGKALPIHRDGFGIQGERKPGFSIFNDSIRFHMPVETHQDAFIYCGGNFFHMQEGEVWLMNNFHPHSAVNRCETKDRYHVIFDVIPNAATLKLIENGDSSLGKNKPELKKTLSWRQADGKPENKGVENRGPDFFLLGAMKSGTSSLFYYLSQHPNIRVPQKKELHYYDFKIYEDWNLQKYLRQFPVKTLDEISGEATPYYLRHPHAPRWIKRDFPNARFIVILRNPVDRAYSQYQFAKQKGKLDKPFSELVKTEDAYVKEDWAKAVNDPTYLARKAQAYSILSRGRYAQQIRNWFKYFPRNQFHFVFTHDLDKNGFNEVQKIYKFLDMDEFNELDVSTRLRVATYDPMDADIRHWLENYFRPRNKALGELLDRKIPW